MAIIYKITNKQNGKIYIGQTRYTLEQRLDNAFCGHFQHAFQWNSNGALYNALRKYGKDNFTYEVLEDKSNDEFSSTKELRNWLNDRECFWIAYYDSSNSNKGYNRTTGGSSKFKLSEETKQDTALAKKLGWSKKTDKDVFRQNVSTGIMKKWKDEEYREKQRLAKTGKKRDPEIGKKIRDTRIKNDSYTWKNDAERVKKQSERMKGKALHTTKLSDEQKSHVSAGVIAAQSRPEVREKMRQKAKERGEKLRGKKRDPEIGKKISETKKRKRLEKLNEQTRNSSL